MSHVSIQGVLVIVYGAEYGVYQILLSLNLLTVSFVISSAASRPCISAAFLGLFTFGTFTTRPDLAARNQTQVEKLGAKTRVNVMAVIMPRPN